MSSIKLIIWRVNKKYWSSQKSIQLCPCNNSTQILCVDLTGHHPPISTYTRFSAAWLSTDRSTELLQLRTRIKWVKLGYVWSLSQKPWQQILSHIATVLTVIPKNRVERCEWMQAAHTVVKHKVRAVAKVGKKSLPRSFLCRRSHTNMKHVGCLSVMAWGEPSKKNFQKLENAEESKQQVQS